MYYTDPKDKGTVYTNGSVALRTPFPFAQLSKIKSCPILGSTVKRTAVITGQPDTYFSIPARIKYKQKTISGYVTFNEEGYYFVAYRHGKNCHVLQS